MAIIKHAVQALLGTTIPIVWAGDVELPHLQRGPAFPAMTDIAVARGFQEMTPWRYSDGNLSNVDGYNPMPLKRSRDGKPIRRRCVPITTSTSTPTPTTSTEQPSSITAAPTLLPCVLHNEDPDQGVTTPFCVCSGSVTLSVLSATHAQSESCGYTTIPGSSAIATISTLTETMTVNCRACPMVGENIVGACTTVAGCTPTAAPTPTIAAWVGNLSTIDIGNAEDGNGGKDLAAEMFKKLRGMCNDSGGCKADEAVMDSVEAILSGEEEPLKPAMYLQDATFSSPTILDQMLSIGISSWISALNNKDLDLCKEVDYEYEADPTGSGCGKGPISPSRLRRKIRRDTGAVIWERSGLALEDLKLKERCFDNCNPPMTCTYQARMCNAPNEITVVMAGKGDPYANRLNIGVKLESESDGFLCEEITAALTAAVAILAPELLSADVLEGVELEAICGFIDDPTSIIGNLTNTVRISSRSEPKLLLLE